MVLTLVLSWISMCKKQNFSEENAISHGSGFQVKNSATILFSKQHMCTMPSFSNSLFSVNIQLPAGYQMCSWGRAAPRAGTLANRFWIFCLVLPSPTGASCGVHTKPLDSQQDVSSRSSQRSQTGHLSVNLAPTWCHLASTAFKLAQP